MHRWLGTVAGSFPDCVAAVCRSTDDTTRQKTGVQVQRHLFSVSITLSSSLLTRETARGQSHAPRFIHPVRLLPVGCGGHRGLFRPSRDHAAGDSVGLQQNGPAVGLDLFGREGQRWLRARTSLFGRRALDSRYWKQRPPRRRQPLRHYRPLRTPVILCNGQCTRGS